LILEDDTKILTTKLTIPGPPDDWKMLYLGGNVQKVIEDSKTNTSSMWKKVHCLTTHAYIVRYFMYKVILDKAKDCIGKMSLEEFYCNVIHPTHSSYIVTPEHAIQADGHSDVKKKFVTYGQILTKKLRTEGENDPEAAVKEIDKVETEMIPDTESEKPNPEYMQTALKGVQIKDDALPFVTLITPTCNRSQMADFLVWSFYRQLYPASKLFWIVCDDGDESEKWRKYLPADDDRIKYINCKTGTGQYLSLAQKLNLCNTYVPDIIENDVDGKPISKPQIVMHFFDFVYHHPLSTYCRVKALLQNPVKQCLGITDYGVYDFESNKSYMSFYPDAQDGKTILCPQSLAYFKTFWEERKFDETQLVLPSYFFITGRMSKAIAMPYEFAMITLYSSGLRDDRNDRKAVQVKADPKISEKSSFSYFNSFDIDAREFMLLLKETVK